MVKRSDQRLCYIYTVKIPGDEHIQHYIPRMLSCYRDGEKLMEFILLTHRHLHIKEIYICRSYTHSFMISLSTYHMLNNFKCIDRARNLS